MAHLSYKEFKDKFGDLGITEWVKYNWIGWSSDKVSYYLRLHLSEIAGIDFDDTDVVDLGTLTWTYNASYGFSSQLNNAKNIGYDTNANILSILYKTNTYVNVANKTSDMQIALGGYDILQPPLILINNSSYTNATTFKKAMEGVLLAYEKA